VCLDVRVGWRVVVWVCEGSVRWRVYVGVCGTVCGCACLRVWYGRCLCVGVCVVVCVSVRVVCLCVCMWVCVWVGGRVCVDVFV
jgi:hypothetical protein